MLAKSCICRDLSGGADIVAGIDPAATTAVCPGPGIADFSKIATLEEMVGHICGRISLLSRSDRPHMFIRELSLYIDYLAKETDKVARGLSPRTTEYLEQFATNLLGGIDYYRGVAQKFVAEERGRFLDQLATLREKLEPATPTPTAIAKAG